MGIHIYHSLDGGRNMRDITGAVSGAKGVDVGGHAAVPLYTDQGLLLGFDNGQIAISQGDVRVPGGWAPLVTLPGAVLSLAVAGRSPSSVIH